MSKLFSLLIILVLNFGIVAEDFNLPTKADYPELNKRGKDINAFVPKDWEIVGKSFGDLNADKLEDCALVIKANYDKFLNKNDGFRWDSFDTNPRVLVILFRDADGFRLAKQSNTFILAPDSPAMSEPFQKIAIRGGVLRLDFEVFFSAGSWSAYDYSYKFRFQNGKFVLIGADKTESTRNSGETESRSYNFLTRRMKISTGNFASDERENIRWKSFRFKKLKTIDSLGKPFDWEIEKDYYI